MAEPAGDRVAPLPDGTLDRVQAVPAIVGEHTDFLVVTGLAGAARDMALMTGDADHLFTMAGAMGGATMLGFGLALAQPERRVLVVTGDGELLMNVGALATIAVSNLPNLSILVVDNGRYGETGHQKSHTSLGTNLERMAAGAGLAATRTVTDAAEIEDARRLLRAGNGTCLVVLRVKPGDPPKYKRLMEPAACRVRFRRALLGHP